MKTFFDTNVLVAAVLEDHPDHGRAFQALDRVQAGKDRGAVCAHGLAELYAILTKLPAPFRHTSAQAWLSIETNVLKSFDIIGLSGNDYTMLLRDAATAAVQGGTIYDAVILKAAAKAKAERIYTLNLKHFQALAPAALEPLLSTP